MVNYRFNELSFQARSTSEWAYHRYTLFALRSLCCIDLPAEQEDVAKRPMNGRPAGPIGEVLRLALVEDALHDRRRLLDAAKVVAPHPDARNRSGGRFS
jgi:hypothetical protein